MLFLTASAPHRIHHFFEQPPLPLAQKHFHAHEEHDTGDKNHSQGDDQGAPKPQHTDCTVQSVAQNTHISPVQLIEVPFLEIALAHNPDHVIVASSFFDASPFSQRAPPAA